jgi:hypothetical protein
MNLLPISDLPQTDNTQQVAGLRDLVNLNVYESIFARIFYHGYIQESPPLLRLELEALGPYGYVPKKISFLEIPFVQLVSRLKDIQAVKKLDLSAFLQDLATIDKTTIEYYKALQEFAGSKCTTEQALKECLKLKSIYCRLGVNSEELARINLEELPVTPSVIEELCKHKESIHSLTLDMKSCAPDNEEVSSQLFLVLSKMPKVKTLVIKNQTFSQFSMLGNSLTKLELINCTFEKPVSSIFEYAPNLEELEIVRGNHQNEEPDILPESSLKILRIKEPLTMRKIPALSSILEELEVTGHAYNDFGVYFGAFSDFVELPDIPQENSLKVLKITHLNKLESLPSLQHARHLERLEISRCTKIEQLPDIPEKNSLKVLTISQLKQLKSFPSLQHARHLEELVMEGAKLDRVKITQLPAIPKDNSLRILTISELDITTTPCLQFAKKLEGLEISGCKEISQLHNIPEDSSLKLLQITDLPKFVTLSNILPIIQKREILTIERVGMNRDLKESMRMIPQRNALKISIACCDKLTQLPDIPVEELEIPDSDQIQLRDSPEDNSLKLLAGLDSEEWIEKIE